MPGFAFEPAEIEKFVYEFYSQADNSAPTAWFLPHIDESFHLFFGPTCDLHGHAGFEEFYRMLTTNLFDRNHDVHDVNVEVTGDTAKVTLSIHLTARVWSPPLPKSLPSENEASFIWELKRDPASGEAKLAALLITAIHFPEGVVAVDAGVSMRYPQFTFGPWGFP